MSIRNYFESKKPTWTKLQLIKDANLKKRQMEKNVGKGTKSRKKEKQRRIYIIENFNIFFIF
jgi:hypothetical protein